MSTVIMAMGVTKSNTVHSPSPGWVSTKKKYPGSNVLMLPIAFVKGKTLEDKRKEAHKLVDACIDTFTKEFKK